MQQNQRRDAHGKQRHAAAAAAATVCGTYIPQQYPSLMQCPYEEVRWRGSIVAWVQLLSQHVEWRRVVSEVAEFEYSSGVRQVVLLQIVVQSAALLSSTQARSPPVRLDSGTLAVHQRTWSMRLVCNDFPTGVLKSGIPALQLMPAPVSTTMRLSCPAAICAAIDSSVTPPLVSSLTCKPDRAATADSTEGSDMEGKRRLQEQ